MRATIAITLLFFAVHGVGCVQSQPVVEEPPPDAGPEPEACAAVIDCTEETLGVQTRGISNQCFECMETSEPRAPFAWGTVAPCSIPDRE